MLDTTSGVRIIFAPKTDEFVKMMRAQDRPIARKVIEIIHDDGDKQIDNLKTQIIFRNRNGNYWSNEVVVYTKKEHKT